MHIQLETPDNNTIRSYAHEQITVNNTVYTTSCIISRATIISDWDVKAIDLLDESTLIPLLQLKPEIILIGHQKPSAYLPMPLRELLCNQRIGVECMSIGAASRTFNVLLSEQRNVVIGFIFDYVG